MLRELLSDYVDTPATDMLCLNAGAALFANERVSSLADGIKLAQSTLREGKAKRKLADVVASTQVHAVVR
jgi:anthranilate phosphoribosyltransferase